MSINYEVVNAMIILLPGYITHYIIKQYTVQKHSEDLSMVFEILLWSLVAYFFRLLLNIFLKLDRFGIPQSFFDSNIANISIALVISILLGIGVSVIVNKKKVKDIAFHLKLTDITGYPSVWDEILDNLQDIKGKIVIRTKSGELIKGTVRNYNAFPEKPMLYIENCTLLCHSEQNGIDLNLSNMKGIFIFDMDTIEYILLPRKET